jgi:hypothetical protein
MSKRTIQGPIGVSICVLLSETGMVFLYLEVVTPNDATNFIVTLFLDNQLKTTTFY